MGQARRVVFLDHCAAWSGGEIALLRLLEALDTSRSLVVLGEDGPLAARLAEAGVEVRVLPLDPRTNRLGRDRAARVPWRSVVDVARYVWRLRGLLREVRPDLVHANSLKSGVYGSLAARLAGVPVVWHVRDRVADDYLPAAVVRLVRALLLLLPDAVLTNSEATRATLGGAVRRAVPHAVLGDPFRPTLPTPPRTRPHPRPTVALVGRLSPWKGQHLFLDALATLHRQGVDVRGRLLGQALFGEDEYAAEVTRRAAELDAQVGAFTGDVGEALGDVDVVVNASVVPEPFGQVVVEAIAHGVPVVVPDTGGPSEIVRDAVSGLTFTAGDADDLAAVLALLLETPELYRRLSEGGLDRARDYAPERIAAEFEGFTGSVRRESPARRLLRAARRR